MGLLSWIKGKRTSGMLQSVNRQGFGKAINRSLALLVVYQVLLLFGPVIVIFLIFGYFSDNSAQYQQLPLGIKLSGPIAGYVAVVYLFHRLFNSFWRRIESIAQAARNVVIDKRYAHMMAGRYANLFSELILISTVRMADSGQKWAEISWTKFCHQLVVIYGDLARLWDLQFM